MYTAPNGNEIVIVTMNSESYQAMTWDQQGLIYGMLKDWEYLVEGTSPESDSNFSNVRLLLGADTTVTDESTYGRTLTNVSATIGEGIIAGSTGSIVFNANTDVIEANDAADLEIGSSDATVEVWYKAPTDGISNTDEKLWFGKFEAGANFAYSMNLFGNSHQVFGSSTGSSWTSTILHICSNEERQVS